MILSSLVFEMPCDSITPVYRFSISLPKSDDWANNSAIPLANYISRLKDGSLSCENVVRHNFSNRDYRNDSMCQRNVIRSRKLPSKPMYLHLHRSAIKSVGGYKFTSSLVLECTDLIQLLSNHCQVVLVGYQVLS